MKTTAGAVYDKVGLNTGMGRLARIAALADVSASRLRAYRRAFRVWDRRAEGVFALTYAKRVAEMYPRVEPMTRALFAKDGESMLTGCGFSLYGMELYSYVRSLEDGQTVNGGPIVVETGVCAGVSTLFILMALDDMGSGHLHSIDLPTLDPAGRVNTDGRQDGAFVPHGLETGWLVAPPLRERWTLHLGESSAVLPEVLTSLHSVDMFLHDSDHSEENMRFEYESAWPRIRPNGLLYSDDVDWNMAFASFIDGHFNGPSDTDRSAWSDYHKQYRTPTRRGLLRKPPNPELQHG